MDHFIPVVVGSFSDGLYIMEGKVKTYTDINDARDDAMEKAVELTKKYNGVSFYPFGLKCLCIEELDKSDKELKKPSPVFPRNINEADDLAASGATFISI